jgi:hypothetical protein
MLLSRAFPLLCSTALLLFGCTGDNPDASGDGAASGDMSVNSTDDGPPGADFSTTDPHVAVLEECVQLAAAVCDRLNKCSPYELRYYYGDTTTCAERLQLTCAPYVELPGSSWTLDRLRACTAGYTNGTCADYFAPGGPAACRPQPGTRTDGATCANSNQCKSAMCNLGLSGCGTCVQPIKSGQACNGQKPCELGTSCVANKCAPDGVKGDACGNGKPACGTGLYCSANACAPVLGIGAMCNPLTTTGECDPIAGLYCDATTRKCAAYKVVDSGQACGQTADGYALCAAGGTCSGTAPMATCVSAAMDSAACGNGTSNNLGCMLPASCSAAICRVFDPSTCK